MRGEEGCEGKGGARGRDPTCSLRPQVWILDSIPGRVSRDMSRRGVDQVLKVLKDVPMPTASRKELTDHLMGTLGLGQDLAAWLGSSLVQIPQSSLLRFGFNIAGAAAMYADYRASEYWDVLALPPRGIEVHVVRAELSDRWTPHDASSLERVAAESRATGGETGTTEAHLLPKAGHWLHVDNPRGLQRLLVSHMKALAAAAP